MTAVCFRSQSVDWSTPAAFYADLDREFRFTLDPCPLGAEGGLFGSSDGLLLDWTGHRVFCNPPYGPGIADWLKMSKDSALAVYLIPARTSNSWFHTHCLRYATEVRFIRGRLKFGTSRNSAPFASMLVIYDNEKGR